MAMIIVGNVYTDQCGNSWQIIKFVPEVTHGYLGLNMKTKGVIWFNDKGEGELSVVILQLATTFQVGESYVTNLGEKATLASNNYDHNYYRGKYPYFWVIKHTNYDSGWMSKSNGTDDGSTRFILHQKWNEVKVEPKKEAKTLFINMYTSSRGGCHSTMIDAKRYIDKTGGYLGTVQIDLTEGELPTIKLV